MKIDLQALQEATNVGCLEGGYLTLLSSHSEPMPCAMSFIVIYTKTCLAGHMEAAGEFGLER